MCTQTHGSCAGEDSVSEPTQCTWPHKGSVCHMRKFFPPQWHSDFLLKGFFFFPLRFLTTSVCIPSILLSILFLAWQLHQKSVGLAQSWGSSVAITPIIRSRSPEEGHHEDGLTGTIQPPNKQADIWSLVLLGSDPTAEPAEFSFPSCTCFNIVLLS